VRWLLAVAAGAALAAPQPASADTGPAATTTSLSAAGVLLVDGVPTFPIGLSRGPARTPGMRQVAAVGVDLFRYNPPLPWADPAALAAARAFDAQVGSVGGFSVVNLCQQCGLPQLGTVTSPLLNTITSGLKDDPGFGIYKGPDEPLWNGLSPKRILPVYAAGRQDDPDHLWMMVQASITGTVAQFLPYSKVTDIQGVDVYPIQAGGNLPLHTVGRLTATMASATPNHAVWTTLQLCTAAAKGLIPTRDQMRFMIWDAIINGAQGINLFGGQLQSCWRGTDATYGWGWTAFNRAAPTLRELRAMNAVLVSPRRPLPVRTGWEGIEFQAGGLGTWWVRANLRTHQVVVTKT
jgi:hypothetical protein